MILATLEEALLKYRVTALPPSNVPNDPKCNPAFWNRTWVNWQDDDPTEFLIDSVGKNRLENINDQLPGSVIAVIAVLLGLAVVGIFALIGLRCNKKYHALKKKQQQSDYRNSRYIYIIMLRLAYTLIEKQLGKSFTYYKQCDETFVYYCAAAVYTRRFYCDTRYFLSNRHNFSIRAKNKLFLLQALPRGTAAQRDTGGTRARGEPAQR